MGGGQVRRRPDGGDRDSVQPCQELCRTAHRVLEHAAEHGKGNIEESI